MRRKRLIAAAAGTLLAAAIVGGVAFETIPSDTNVFTACMLKNVGTIRLIDPSLPSSSLLVKGANNRVAAPLGGGWEDQRHDLLFPLPCCSGSGWRACS